MGHLVYPWFFPAGWSASRTVRRSLKGFVLPEPSHVPMGSQVALACLTPSQPPWGRW